MEDDERNLINVKEIFNSTNKFKFLKNIKSICPISSVTLHDIKIGNTKNEDAVFLENDYIYNNIRRANCIVNSNGNLQIGSRGIIKFFDYKLEFESEKKLNEKYSKMYHRVMNPINQAFDNKQSIYIYKTYKADGKNFQVSYNIEFESWIIGSNNVSLLAATRDDLDFYKKKLINLDIIQKKNEIHDDKRKSKYSFVLKFADSWFDLLDILKKTHNVDDFIRETREYTLIGEKIGVMDDKNIKYYDTNIFVFFAMVKNNSKDICVNLDISYSLFEKYGLKFVDKRKIGPFNDINLFLKEIREIYLNVLMSPLQVEGEGSVLYISSVDNNNEEKIISVCKLKTLEYIIFKKIREKLKEKVKEKSILRNNLDVTEKYEEKLINEINELHVHDLQGKDKSANLNIHFYKDFAKYALKNYKKFISKFNIFLQFAKFLKEIKNEFEKNMSIQSIKCYDKNKMNIVNDIDYLSKFKNLSLDKYIKKGPLGDVEGLLHIIDIMSNLKRQNDFSKDKYLFTNLNSSNIILTRSLDIKINYDNPQQDPNYFAPELFSFGYFSDAENNYIQRNKIIVWAFGALMHLMFSGEEPWANHRSANSIMDLISLSKDGVPNLKVPNFTISNKIKNVNIRILLRNCLERNQIKRIYDQCLEETITNYLLKILLHDINFDFYESQQFKKNLPVLKKINYFLINRLKVFNDKLKNVEECQFFREFTTSRKPIHETNNILALNIFQFDKKITLLYFTKDYFKILSLSGEVLLDYYCFSKDINFKINCLVPIDGIWNLRPRIILGFNDGEIVKISSIFSTKLEHIELLKAPNVNLSYFPDFNREKVINQNEKNLLVWDLNKNHIILTTDCKNSNNMLFMNRDNRNKNYSSFVYNNNTSSMSSDILFKNKVWKLRNGKKISSELISSESEEISFMCRLEQYHCKHNDSILTGFSNGYISLFRFNSSSNIKKFKAHNLKINDIIHLKEYNINYIASCSDNLTIKIWDLSTVSQIKQLHGHYKGIINLKYLKHLNYRYIASSSLDSFTIIWDFVKGEKLANLDNDSSITHTLYFLQYWPSTIVNATKENKLYFWSEKAETLNTSGKSLSFKELKYFGKKHENVDLKICRENFLEKVEFREEISKKIDLYHELKEIINNKFKDNKKLENNNKVNNEIKKFIKTIKGESNYKIEFETNIKSLANNPDLTPENLRDDKRYINFVFKLLNINTSIDSYSQFIGEIKRLIEIDPNYFSKIKIFDSVKTNLFPRKYNNNNNLKQFKHVEDIVNINNFLKYHKTTKIEKVQIFIDYVLTIQKMYYNDKLFFKVKIDNIFFNKKLRKLKIISYYVPYSIQYDWSVKFNSLEFWKEKEEYLKTTFINFKKFCFNDGNLKVIMNETRFNFEGEKIDKQFFWKNKNIFIFKFISHYLRRFIKSSKKGTIFQYHNKKNIYTKQFRSIEKVKNYIIYFYSNNLKEKIFDSPNKNHDLDKMTAVEQTNKESKNERDDNSKINYIIFIKSLKITITVAKKCLSKYNRLGVKMKSIIADEQIKCLIFFKEHNSIIIGDLKGNVSFLRLMDLQKIKKKLPLNNGKSIDTIIQLKGYRKRNDIFAMAGHDMKIIIFDYDGNILKIIHEGTKNYIKKLEYCQSLNCLLYIAKHEAFDKNYTVGHALKIYDLNEKDKPRNPLILQKFNEVLFMKKIYILGIEMIITSTKENLKYKEEDKFNYFTDNSIIIKSEQENPKQKTEEVKLKDERTLRQKAEDAKKNYKGRKENINFFHLKSLVKNKYSPILSIATEIQKITCAAVIKDLGNNYIAFSGDKIFIEIYKITMNNYMVFKEEKVLILNMNFEKIRKHCNLPFFCYLSTFDKFTLAVANELTTYNGKFNFFEINEKKREFETILSNTQINQQNVEEEQKKLKESKENKEGNDLKS